jgi:hypothetical protein
MQPATTAYANWLNRAQVSGCAGSRHPGQFQLTKIITITAALAIQNVNIFFIFKRGSSSCFRSISEFQRRNG